MRLFDFVELRILDIVDILLVATLIYFLYKLLRGTIAVSIFIGLVSIYLISLIVKVLDMTMLSTILGKFISVGVLLVIIVFQQEIRKFLLIIGQNNIFISGKFTLQSILPWNWDTQKAINLNYSEIFEACKTLSTNKTGALIIISKISELRGFASTGIELDAVLSAKLINSIFIKNSPLHDGAIMVVRNRITAASCILPVSENQNIPDNLGLRHRAALGLSEQTDAIIIIVSEETGSISYAINSQLHYKISLNKLKSTLVKNFISFV